MPLNQEDNRNEVEESIATPPEKPKEQESDGEFKVTVRKLEMPVRPRGVLAE
jgi:hypothetical protein